jgi:hypothetical protein
VQIGCPADLSTSMPNTRLSRCAQFIDARRSAGVCSSECPSRGASLPCPAWPASPARGTGCWGRTRHYKRVRMIRGLGTRFRHAGKTSCSQARKPSCRLSRR